MNSGNDFRSTWAFGSKTIPCPLRSFFNGESMMFIIFPYSHKTPTRSSSLEKQFRSYSNIIILHIHSEPPNRSDSFPHNHTHTNTARHDHMHVRMDSSAPHVRCCIRPCCMRAQHLFRLPGEFRHAGWARKCTLRRHKATTAQFRQRRRMMVLCAQLVKAIECECRILDVVLLQNFCRHLNKIANVWCNIHTEDRNYCVHKSTFSNHTKRSQKPAIRVLITHSSPNVQQNAQWTQFVKYELYYHMLYQSRWPTNQLYFGRR